MSPQPGIFRQRPPPPTHTRTRADQSPLYSPAFVLLETNTIVTLFTPQIIRSLNLKPVLSIETHCHADHMSVLLRHAPRRTSSPLQHCWLPPQAGVSRHKHRLPPHRGHQRGRAGKAASHTQPQTPSKNRPQSQSPMPRSAAQTSAAIAKAPCNSPPLMPPQPKDGDCLKFGSHELRVRCRALLHRIWLSFIIGMGGGGCNCCGCCVCSDLVFCVCCNSHVVCQCMATPGHTAGSMSYAWSNNGQVTRWRWWWRW
jgi:hypothetical protein